MHKLPLRLAGVLLATLLPAAPVWAQDAARGATLYMRSPQDGRSCVNCHGPDPASNPNNILRAADNPDALTKALNTVSAMGFLRPQLTDADRADLAAFLGTVVAQSEAGVPHLWPLTIEFGTVQLAATGEVQRLRMRNPAATAAAVQAIAVAGDGIALAHDCPAQLPAGSACDIDLRFTPTRTGWSRGSLRVDVAGRPQPLLAGISVLASTEPASALQWPDIPTGRVVLDGAQPEAGGVVRRRLTLANAGPMPATLALATIVGPQSAQFRVEDRCGASPVLQAGARCDVVIAFTPNQLPLAEAVLQVRSDQGHPTSLRLEGSARAEPVPPPVDPIAAADSGGGCSVGPPRPGREDPTLVALLLGAAWAFGRRRWTRK
jgi:cytochrome c553